MAENKTNFVIDASVIYKWATHEPEYLEEALLVKDHFVEKINLLMVPVFCFAEVCNALFIKRPRMALEYFSQLIEFGIEEYAISFNLANLSFQLMERYPGISFYDASYHALAIRKNGTFITADEKYYRKTHKEGHIMLLKDYGKKR